MWQVMMGKSVGSDVWHLGPRLGCRWGMGWSIGKDPGMSVRSLQVGSQGNEWTCLGTECHEAMGICGLERVISGVSDSRETTFLFQGLPSWRVIPGLCSHSTELWLIYLLPPTTHWCVLDGATLHNLPHSGRPSCNFMLLVGVLRGNVRVLRDENPQDLDSPCSCLSKYFTANEWGTGQMLESRWWGRPRTKGEEELILCSVFPWPFSQSDEWCLSERGAYSVYRTLPSQTS